jgi:HAD superfamily hydrolase (TIGR01509 family)
VPLLLIDLDDSLIDRGAGLRRWAEIFCERHGLGDRVDWIVEADRRGYAPRPEFHAALRERFALADTVDELAERYDAEYPELAIAPAPNALALLSRLRREGWKVGVVTNGRLLQERKLAAAGLADLVDTCCISEVEGVRKPDARIFELAAERCGETLDGAWMAGDNPDADLRGAHALGLSTIWFRHGRDWVEPDFEPTLVVDTLEQALARLAGAATAEPGA